MSESEPELFQMFDAKIKLLSGELKRAKTIAGKRVNPVKRKSYRTILGRLIALREGLMRMQTRGAIDLPLKTTILDILFTIDKHLPEAANWDIADGLKELLPRVVSDGALYKLLLEEKVRSQEAKNLWTDFFDQDGLDKQLAGFENADGSFNRMVVISRLASLYAIRNEQGRHDRAREGIRLKYLVRMAWILLFSIFILILLWIYSSDNSSFTRFLFVAAVSGAIGALLSRALRLRNLNLITEINTLYYTLFLQAVLGGILAIIVLLILKTEIITIKGFDLKTATAPYYFVVGLISGFSEPFALGIIEKISRKGQSEEQ